MSKKLFGLVLALSFSAAAADFEACEMEAGYAEAVASYVQARVPASSIVKDAMMMEKNNPGLEGADIVVQVTMDIISDTSAYQGKANQEMEIARIRDMYFMKCMNRK